MKTQATLSQPSAVPGSPLLQVSGALFGIIAFILIAAWLAKRFGLAGKTAGTRGLKVSASTPLGPRERVVIVEVEDARLVLGVTAHNITPLHTLSAPPADITPGAAADKPADFRQLMQKMLKRPGKQA